MAGHGASIAQCLSKVRDDLIKQEKISNMCSGMAGDHDATSTSDCHLSREALLSSIEAVFKSVVCDIAQGNAPQLAFTNRTKWANISFGEDSGLKHNGQDVKTITRFGSIQSVNKMALTMKLLAKIHHLLQTDTYCTKRELYYQEAGVFGSQSVVDVTVDNICCLLQAPRWKLHVLATSKGLVAGELQFMTQEGTYIDCTDTQTGVLIPNHVQGITNVRSCASCVLVVEKDATFQRLLDANLSEHIGPHILITGKGFPDVNTRLFLRKLWEDLHLPTFALVDADPHGIEIMTIYKYGSKAQSGAWQSLALPSLHWLGLLPSDIQRLRVPRDSLLPMTDRDRSKARDLLTRPFIASKPLWRAELELLLNEGHKAEIQSMTSLGSNFIASVYLVNKILCSGWI